MSYGDAGARVPRVPEYFTSTRDTHALATGSLAKGPLAFCLNPGGSCSFFAK